MSTSEIADNKWELEAVKPPTTTFAGICQIMLIGGFSLIFVYILQGSLVGMFGATRDGGMAQTYGKMSHEAAPK
jgi:hypothetical protein